MAFGVFLVIVVVGVLLVMRLFQDLTVSRGTAVRDLVYKRHPVPAARTSEIAGLLVAKVFTPTDEVSIVNAGQFVFGFGCPYDGNVCRVGIG
ncbi:hypothetical protein LTR09_012389 [Extremus antarcticus]|uniref:Uncharacterized protein n=1 Tax=Extremus antarcticus TaxID=702011 RepID=A0AAJ0D550_9PEZI|nr:hypothetical protein LTR09_012389 [Extremus antarcticus]